MACPNRRRRPGHVTGHTLIEATIVVAVVGILAAFGLPSLGDAMARQSISVGASSWRDAHAIGRNHAILRRVVTVLCPSDDGVSCRQATTWEGGFMLFEDANRNRNRDANERVVRVFGRQPGVRMTTSAGRRTIAFQPSGRTDGSNVTMTVCDPARPAVHGRRLITSNSGRTRNESLQCEA